MPSKPEKPTRAASILAHCWQCLGYYEDGKTDCENVKCPLYPFMPYKKNDPDLWWLEYNPKRAGRVTWEESSRDLTEEDRARIRARLKGGKTADPGPEEDEDGFGDLFD